MLLVWIQMRSFFISDPFAPFAAPGFAARSCARAACPCCRCAGQRSPAADKTAPQVALDVAEPIAPTMTDHSSPRDAAACGWPEARLRDARSPACGRRLDNSDQRWARYRN